MRTSLPLAGCLFALLAAVTPASAAEDTSSAAWVMPGCSAFLSPPILPEQAVKAGFCLGLTEGVWDTGYAEGWICSPPDIVGRQALRIVVQYIAARPARMDERFTVLAAEALRAAWICPAKP